MSNFYQPVDWNDVTKTFTAVSPGMNTNNFEWALLGFSIMMRSVIYRLKFGFPKTLGLFGWISGIRVTVNSTWWIKSRSVGANMQSCSKIQKILSYLSETKYSLSIQKLIWFWLSSNVSCKLFWYLSLESGINNVFLDKREINIKRY